MDKDEQLCWLALSRIAGLSASVWRRLQASLNDPLAILQAPRQMWRLAGADPALCRQLQLCHRQRSHPAWQQARADQALLHREGAEILLLGHAHYPALLAEIHDPPPLLYALGQTDCLRRAQLAVVGSRKASSASRRHTRLLVGELVEQDLSICSGLALGIDAEAHRAAMAGGGTTVAVMATGIDRIYPRQHRQLARQIAEQGLLLTEFVPGTEPRREFFPRRNRVISGLSVGVLVVEAALRSGSLITARLALEQNREVFAVPHAVADPGGRGCHQLLRNGATLVESSADILAELGSLYRAHCELQHDSGSVSVPQHLRAVYDALGYGQVSLDELASSCEADVGLVMAAVVELELAGLVESRDGLYMRS